MKLNSRRKFIRHLSASSFLLTSGFLTKATAEEEYEKRILPFSKPYSANDAVKIAVIGCGIQGNNDLQAALRVPGAEMAGACDLYTGRLTRMKEVHGQELFTTKNYHDLLARKDIDAVIIATGDHWHSRITIDALKAGKHVYCEKPMVHKLNQGAAVIQAQKASGKILQVGSQGISGLDYLKAKELYEAGEIGQLNCIETSNDRQDALGAWQYSLPTDASTQTVDWDTYVSNMNTKPKYDENKFFRWRNYKDFGTGMAGDLYVHLITGIHYVTSSAGPARILSSGQRSYWNDGRDVPDVITTLMDYPKNNLHPAFQVMLRVNFVSGAGGSGMTRFIGSEGAMTKTGNGLKITHSILAKAPGFGGWDSVFTYPEAMQKQMQEEYNAKWSEEDRKRPIKPPIEYRLPEGYDSHTEHFANFFAGIRENKPVIENPTIGFRAAAPCLAANESYFQKKIIFWDPIAMKQIIK